MKFSILYEMSEIPCTALLVVVCRLRRKLFFFNLNYKLGRYDYVTIFENAIFRANLYFPEQDESKKTKRPLKAYKSKHYT